MAGKVNLGCIQALVTKHIDNPKALKALTKSLNDKQKAIIRSHYRTVKALKERVK